MSRILVTGANGFVGNHLIKELYDNKHTVIGVGGPNLASSGKNPYLSSYLTCDLTDADQVAKLDFKNIDAIIHLAGLANIGMSFTQPARFISDNGTITINLLETLLQQGVKPRVIAVSSGAVYSPQQSMPIDEAGELINSSPYVVSKLLTENIASYYRTRGIDCVIARPFNHIGPGQTPGFLLPDLTAQVKIAVDTGTEVVVGNLNSKRDYTDVRDVAKAYRLLATTKDLKHTVYNVCSGKSTAGQYFLDEIISILSPTDRPSVRIDKSRFRPNDAAEIIGDSSLLQQETGWHPTIPLKETIRDFVTSSVKS